jgi:hypothetical protein
MNRVGVVSGGTLLRISPGHPEAVIITGAKISPAGPNQAAAIAFHLSDFGFPVLVHAINHDTQSHFTDKGIRSLCASNLEVGVMDELWREVVELSHVIEIGGVNILLYESFTEYLPEFRKERPFLPLIEEDFTASYVHKMVVNRAAMMQGLWRILESLDGANIQRPIVLFVSSLASHRPGGQLALDVIHKSTGSTLFETVAIEASHYLPQLQACFVEILPGIVRGIYQDEATKERLMMRSHVDFPSFDVGYGPENFPQIAPHQIAEVVLQYLKNPEDPNTDLPDEVKALLLGGRESLADLKNELEEAFSFDETAMHIRYLSIPQYALQKGIMFGELPSTRPGHLVRVPLVPRGQLF